MFHVKHSGAVSICAGVLYCNCKTVCYGFADGVLHRIYDRMVDRGLGGCLESHFEKLHFSTFRRYKILFGAGHIAIVWIAVDTQKTENDFAVVQLLADLDLSDWLLGYGIE